MSWFYRIFTRHKTGPSHISEACTTDEISSRLAALTKDEQRAYGWLLKGYSEAWITETMGLERQNAKAIFAGIYQKLGVNDSREIIWYYAPGEIYIDHPASEM